MKFSVSHLITTLTAMSSSLATVESAVLPREYSNSTSTKVVLFPREDHSNATATVLYHDVANSTIPIVDRGLANSTTATSTYTCEHQVKLFASSTKFGQVGITHYHEGAGIDYMFLTGSDSPTYTYNSCTGQLYITSGQMKQYLNEENGAVQLTVTGPSGFYGYQVNRGVRYLTLNGDSSGWEACKNTGDPYRYSTNMFQLSWRGNTYNQCEAITVVLQY